MNRILKRYPDQIQDIIEGNRKSIIMNAGIALIGLALILLSVAFMVSPSTAITGYPTDCGRYIGITENTISDYCRRCMTITEGSSDYNDSIIFCQASPSHR